MFLLSLDFYRVICSLVQQLSVISWIERNPTQSLWFLRKTVLSVRAACSLHLALTKASLSLLVRRGCFQALLNLLSLLRTGPDPEHSSPNKTKRQSEYIKNK